MNRSGCLSTGLAQKRGAGAALDLCRGSNLAHPEDQKELGLEGTHCFLPPGYLGAGKVSRALAGGMVSG